MLEEQGWKPENVAGTSAGAITAAVIAAGYTSDEVRDITFGLDYRRFKDSSWQNRIPLMGKPLSVLATNGIYKGDEFIRWMTDLLAAKGIRTFGDLRTKEKDAKYTSRLQVIASDLSARRLLVLPRDAGVLGLEPDELDVALAVRMSMSIPIFFRPVRVTDKEGQRSRDRRRRDPLELPGLALRLPGRRGSAVADVRASARRAGSEDPDRDADSETGAAPRSEPKG